MNARPQSLYYIFGTSLGKPDQPPHGYTLAELEELKDAGKLKENSRVTTTPSISLTDLLSVAGSGTPGRGSDRSDQRSGPQNAARVLAERIHLDRPLVFFDLETTGALVAKDRVIEFAATRVATDGALTSWVQRINPTIPIPDEATGIHGITDAMVADQPTFAETARRIVDFLGDADLAGYNVTRFDIPLLAREFELARIEWPWMREWRNRVVVDVMNIYHTLRPRNLSGAYLDICGRSLQNAHAADADVQATLEILSGLIVRGELRGEHVDHWQDIVEDNRSKSRRHWLDFSGWFILGQDDVYFNQGKRKGTSFREAMRTGDPDGIRGYLKWMIERDFSRNTRDVAQFLLEKMPRQKSDSFGADWQEFMAGVRERFGMN